MNQWQIGNVKITRLVESEGLWPGTWLLPEATRENVRKEQWLSPVFSDDTGKLRMSIHSYVLESAGMRILVDTCIGNDKQRAIARWSGLHGPFLDDLAGAGYAPGAIDLVLCTHLHVDHVGWNTTLKDGKWVPTFARARYLFAGTEWDYWSRHENADFRAPVEDSVRPVVASGLADMIDAGHRLTEEVWVEPTPGHTPGHLSVRISSLGREAVITGDVMHHPIQCARPQWGSNFDYDPGACRMTRLAFLERWADKDVLVFGSHFPTPSCGRIVSAADGAFRFVAAEV
jgi:glyoxylase-like metal-dependent hydrolase (beta-lactamase superfamily II)